MGVEDYNTDNVDIEYLSDLLPTEGDALIGKRVCKVVATEYGLNLLFDDDTELEIQGHTYGDCALNVSLNIL